LQNIILILQRTSLEKLRHENLILVNYYSTPGVFERKAFDEIPQSGFYNQELDYVFNVQLTAPIKAVYEKIKTQSKLTIDYLEVSQGIKPNRQALHNVPIHSDCKKYLLGKDIQPYVVNWSGTYIDYNLEEVSQLPNVRLRTPDLFENSVKIIVRKIVSERLVVALDFEKYYVDSASYILLPKVNVPEDFVYLALAILTSPIIKFCYRIEYPERKLAFPQIRGIDIGRLPFPDTELSENVSIIKSVVVEVKKLYTDVKIGKVKGSAIYKTSEARQIDNLLAQLYNLNELDLSLIDAYLEQQ
jgi:hypothetical protein